MSLHSRTNLITNPISDTVAATTNWVPIRSTATVQSGFLQLTITDAALISTGQRLQAATNTIYPAFPGVLYTLTAQGRTNATVPSMCVAHTFATAAGALIGGSATIGAGLTVDNTTFSTLPALTVLAPPTAAFLVPQVAIFGTGARSIGQTFDVRHIIIEAASAGPYFDGSTSADDNFTYAWTGTANASTSEAQSKLRFDLHQGSLTQSAVRAATI